MIAISRARCGPSVIAAGALSVAIGLAAAQPIRIPDFRTGQDAPVKLSPGETCVDCGVIRAVREIRLQRPVPVPQAVRSDREGIDRTLGSDVHVGAVIALPMGEGGRPYVGGVGTPEMRERFAETTYELVVRLDNGGWTSLQRSDGARFQVGDRVRVRGVQLELLAN